MSDGAVTIDRVRRERLTRQGLRRGAPRRPLAEALAGLVGVPMPVGASAALALFARGLITRREDLDAAWLQRGELAAVPGPRGMLWLCAAADAPLLRSFAVADHAAREARVASACALTARDLLGARDALREALASPRRAEELRAALPPSMTRSLGTPGQRAGAVTLAGLVLRGMWCVGEVSRAPASGRLDGETFVDSIEPHPRVTPNAAESVDLVAARWFAAHGPASAKEFAAAFGIAAGRASAALKPLGLQALRVDEETLLSPSVDEPAPWAPDEVVLLGLRDPLTDANPSLGRWAEPTVARAAQMRHLGPGPVVIVRGEVVGGWALDAASRVVLRVRGALDPAAQGALVEAGAATERFLASALGPSPSLHGTVVPRALPPLTAEISGGL
ncbi:MAG: crosslink repair DNA glycosylase YcaQ family protein [Polyangiales bacterium]